MVALAVSAWLALAPAARAEVQLSLRNGRVTIVAKDATVRQILAEWARVGRTTIVNAERIPGGPVTLELKDVPESEALDVLLRTLSGYIAAPRVTLGPADASLYDSIAVMPTVASAVVRPAAGPSNAPAPFSPPPAFNQNEDDQDNGAPRPATGPQPGRPPIFSTFPAPQNGNANPNAPRPMLPVVRPGTVAQPQNTNVNELPQPAVAPAPPQAAPTTSPGGLVGTSAPGMLPPPALQPGQVVPQPPPAR
jgi:hypothetical protein